MIVNPANGDVYVTNTEANNRVRFEGVGDYVGVLGPKPSGDPRVGARQHPQVAHHGARCVGRQPRHARHRVQRGSASPQQTHSYGVTPTPLDVKGKSVATPLGMAISDDGSTLYVAAFGSNAVAVYDTAAARERHASFPTAPT